MKVSKSGYYKWRASKQSERRESDAAGTVRFDKEVRKAFFTGKCDYGTRRIRKELIPQGIVAGRRRIASSMKRQGLVTKHRELWKPRTTDSSKTERIAPNRLEDGANRPAGPGEVIVGDITYIRRADGGFFYLSTFTDLFSRRIVGWSLRGDLTAKLVTEALGMALKSNRVKEGAIVHSDRGSQYGSDAFLEMLQTRGLLPSMSRKGNCWDNAWSESLFATIKKELVGKRLFRDFAGTLIEFREWIDVFYNTVRRHSALDYLSPAAFERRHRLQKTNRPAQSGPRSEPNRARLLKTKKENRGSLVSTIT